MLLKISIILQPKQPYTTKKFLLINYFYILILFWVDTVKADDVTEKEIMVIVNKFIETYSKRDIEGIMSLVAPDPDVCLLDSEPGQRSVGLNAIEAYLNDDWSQYEASSYEFNWINISAAGPVAWIASEVHFIVKSGGQSIIIPSYVTAVFEKKEDKWLMMQGHFSIPELNNIQENNIHV